MLSIGMGCYVSHKEEDSEKLIKTVKVTRIIDCALSVIFGLLAILGYTGVLPIGVGIAFTVVSLVEVGLLALCQRLLKCAEPTKSLKDV